jgi:hypothetical protein
MSSYTDGQRGRTKQTEFNHIFFSCQWQSEETFGSIDSPFNHGLRNTMIAYWVWYGLGKTV